MLCVGVGEGAHGLFAFALFDFVKDPSVGFFEAGAEGDRGGPAEEFFDHGVVGVPSADAFGGVELVVPFQFYAGDVFGDGDELVDADHFVAAEVDGV